VRSGAWLGAAATLLLIASNLLFKSTPGAVHVGHQIWQRLGLDEILAEVAVKPVHIAIESILVEC
jgi:hypothetical protein